MATRLPSPYPPSPRKIKENILKAQLVEIDRNSIGSCYDNVLVAMQQDDADSEASVEETDLTGDLHESDVEPTEWPGKESDVILGVPLEEAKHENDVNECDDVVDEEYLAQEMRVRETLKSIPANLVCLLLHEVLVIV